LEQAWEVEEQAWEVEEEVGRLLLCPAWEVASASGTMALEVEGEEKASEVEVAEKAWEVEVAGKARDRWDSCSSMGSGSDN